MERLWTPWRMQYVTTADRTPGCFLCVTAAEDRDAENLIVARGERAFVILNRYPYNTAHTLIAPYAHHGDLATLDPATASEMMALTQRLVDALKREYDPDGFNIGLNLGRIAGAGLPDHLHTHVVPRWAGDTNFMTTTGDVKVMPETLDQTYERVRRALAGG